MKIVPSEGEHYHVYNRGVERRDIFDNVRDIQRFLESVRLFNAEETIGSLYEHRFSRKERDGARLVDIVCYCLNPNHYHFVLRQNGEKGIQRFMQRLGTGYTNYFNEKYQRTGALFEGRYKAVHITSNEQLLHTSVYVNLNNALGSSTPKLSASSWSEYMGECEQAICSKDVVLGQFSQAMDYARFALEGRDAIIQRKRQEKEMQWLLGS